MELVVLIILVVLVVLVVLGRGTSSLSGLVINGIVGVILLFVTNLFVQPPIPINLLTVLVCAIGGVVGWLIILILHLLGIAFYVAV